MNAVASASINSCRIHSSEVRIVSVTSPALSAASSSDRSDSVRVTGVLLRDPGKEHVEDHAGGPPQWWTLTYLHHAPGRSRQSGTKTLRNVSAETRRPTVRNVPESRWWRSSKSRSRRLPHDRNRRAPPIASSPAIDATEQRKANTARRTPQGRHRPCGLVRHSPTTARQLPDWLRGDSRR